MIKHEYIDFENVLKKDENYDEDTQKFKGEKPDWNDQLKNEEKKTITTKTFQLKAGIFFYFNTDTGFLFSSKATKVKSPEIAFSRSREYIFST